MHNEVRPSVVIVAALCAVCVIGLLAYRLFLAHPSYRGALKRPDRIPRLVRTPYGYMTEENVARAGALSPVRDAGRSSGR